MTDRGDDAAGQMFAATAGTVEQIRALLGEQLQDFILPHSESSAILDAASAEGFVLLGEPTEEP